MALELVIIVRLLQEATPEALGDVEVATRGGMEGPVDLEEVSIYLIIYNISMFLLTLKSDVLRFWSQFFKCLEEWLAGLFINHV